jgi:hypothetical protein
MPYEYKCVAGPTVVSVRRAKDRDHGVKAFEDIMNREAAGGWEFVTVDDFHTSEPDGWLSRKRVYVSSKMLVFRRLKAEVAPLAVVMPHKEPVGEAVVVEERAPELVAEKADRPAGKSD